MKKFLIMVLAFSLAFGFAIPVYATEQTLPTENSNEITPYALVLDTYGLTKAVKSGNTISATAFTKGRANATSSYVRIDLYRKASGSSSYALWKSGTTMKNSSGGIISTSEEWSTVSGYSYKVVSTHTAYAGSIKETKTDSIIL